MHKSIENTLSRRNVLKGAAAVPVAATPVVASTTTLEGVSKRIGELFQDWQRNFIAYGEACDNAYTAEAEEVTNKLGDATRDAWAALNRQPALNLQDVAVKGHAIRQQWEGCYFEEEDMQPIWDDINRLALVGEG